MNKLKGGGGGGGGVHPQCTIGLEVLSIPCPLHLMRNLQDIFL